MCSQPSVAIPEVLPVEQRFHIEFSCEDPNQEKCSVARLHKLTSELVKNAGLRIASQLNIRRTVVVSVLFKPLDDSTALASTVIPQWWGNYT